MVSMNRWGIAAIAYVLLGALAVWVAEAIRGHSAFLLNSPWLVFNTAAGAHLFSALLGLAIAAIVVLSTRFMVDRFRFAQRLHGDLRPLALSLSSTMVLVLSLTSAFGEELLFRGLLLPWIGLLPQALIFGALHQTGTGSRWAWIVWAFAVGLMFGSTYQLTGSLVGPVVAHALINAINFSYLKSHNPSTDRKALGGLLGQRS